MLDPRETIGDIGEKVVQEFFNSTRSNYKFDEEKDGTIEQFTYQVKAFRLNKVTQSFWLSNNKTKKLWENIDKVGLLFFVRNPENETDLAELYLAIDHKNSWFKAYRNDGTPCRAYPLTKCLKLYNISREYSDKLYKLSSGLRSVP